MLRQKDDQILNEGQIRSLYPHISFAPSSYEELGWMPYTPPAPEPQPAPPIIVSPRQIRQALTAQNLRAQVETAIAAGDQDLKDWWEYATAFEENHPMVVAMATGLNVSEEDLHNLFLLAASL